ncbi:hypothetical protein Acsp03_34140 [Actinomadura sp. NBRC 104412]|nr:hypothetical protein Acsp03_34140 [Actinomadura sp. NBRC 104412]
MPHSRPADLLGTAVAFHDEQVSSFKAVAFYLCAKELNLMNIGEVQSATRYVGYPQERIKIVYWTALRLFLNSTLHLGDLCNCSQRHITRALTIRFAGKCVEYGGPQNLRTSTSQGNGLVCCDQIGKVTFEGGDDAALLS